MKKLIDLITLNWKDIFTDWETAENYSDIKIKYNFYVFELCTADNSYSVDIFYDNGVEYVPIDSFSVE